MKLKKGKWMKKMLDLLKKKIYYYVQTCPNCKSRVTGRYIKRPRYQSDEIYLERNSLLHGELVRFVDHDVSDNCYCEDCGHEWYYNVVGRLISKERYEEEGLVRGARQKLKEFNEKHPRKIEKNVLKRLLKTLPKY